MDAQKIRCEGCGELAPCHDIITYGRIDSGHQQLCSRCFNAEVARLNGLEGFEDFRFEPILPHRRYEGESIGTIPPCSAHRSSRSMAGKSPGMSLAAC